MMNMVIMIIRIITRKKTMINDEYGHDVHYSLHYVVHYFVHYEGFFFSHVKAVTGSGCLLALAPAEYLTQHISPCLH